MKNNKKIKQVFKSIPAIEGAGVHLNRVFGFHQEIELPVPREHNAFAFIFQDSAYFDKEHDKYSYKIAGKNYFDFENECKMQTGNCVLFDKGDTVMIKTEQEKVRFLLVSGRPIREPVAWYGPIVMNTQEELKTAFQEYQEGTFIK